MKVVSKIANGGFGQVDQVEMPDGTHAARKVFALSPQIAATGADAERLKKRFAQEVRVQLQMPPELFIPVIAHGASEDPPWFVMPLCARTLQNEIDDHRKANSIPIDALVQVLESLEHLETLDYVHRDLKPSNVLFHDGRWKLTDLGLVQLPTAGTTKLTTTLRAWGTESYCAPEQVMSFSDATCAADQYSFGCILRDIEAGTPRLPYGVQTSKGPLGMIIEVCTQGDPAKRFKSISGLRGALLAALSTPPEPSKVSPKATEIAASLAPPLTMSQAQLSALHEFVNKDQTPEDRWTVFAALTVEALDLIKTTSDKFFDDAVRAYLSWTKQHFDFTFCDAIILRLERIFELGTIAQKSAAVLAGAALAEHHNRWYVMGRIVNLCKPTMDEVVAKRISIDIRAQEVESDFRACAERINRNVTELHPIIAEAIKTPPI